MDEGSLADRMTEVARHLQESHDDPQATFQSAVEVMESVVDGCDSVGLSFVSRGQAVETVAAIGEMARGGDQLQYELGEGPCLDAVWDRQIVRSPDLAADQRWPVWGPRVVEATSARSVLSFQLFTHADRLGALNLYGKERDAFDDVAVGEGFAVAAHVAIAVAASLRISALVDGLASRTLIGQATGILMERFDLDAARAFSVLTRMSSQGNVKVRDLAAEIVTNRHDSSGTN